MAEVHSPGTFVRALLLLQLEIVVPSGSIECKKVALFKHLHGRSECHLANLPRSVLPAYQNPKYHDVSFGSAIAFHPFGNSQQPWNWKQIIPMPIAAIVVTRRRFNWNVNQIQICIGRKRSPSTSIPGYVCSRYPTFGNLAHLLPVSI